jgi:hypothetical protein
MAVKYTQTFKTYEDAAAEARRAQAMAEALQQQAYQPIQMDAAGPISYTQGLAKVLQSYLAGREGRKAREAEAESKRIGREEFKDYISAFEPERATTPVEMATGPRALQQRMELKPQNLDLGQIAQGMGTPTISEQGAMGYTLPTGKMPSSEPMQFTTGSLTPAQRRAKILEGMGSGNPMVQAIAQAEYTKKPEIAEFGTTPQFDEQGRGFVVNKAGDVRYLPGVKAPAAAPAAVTPTTIMKNGRKVVVDARTGMEIGLAPPDAQSVGSKETAEGLRKEFTSQTGKYREISDAWQKIKSAATNPSAANDIALVFSYMRALDPASTVREGEFATAQNAAGIPVQVINAYNKLVSGERLSQPQRQDFLQSAYGLVESQMPNAQSISSRYSDIAKRSGLLPENVVDDPFKSARVPRLTGNNDPVYATLKSGDLFISPDGVMRRKK